jgi:hypothetical protein
MFLYREGETKNKQSGEAKKSGEEGDSVKNTLIFLVRRCKSERKLIFLVFLYSYLIFYYLP